MLRRLLTPRLLVLHVVVLVAVIVMVNLGFWQLRRLDQAQTINARLEQRTVAPTLTEREFAAADPDELEYRHATVTGRYVPEHELVHLARSYRGRGGNHVLTPLVTEGGMVVLVDRGWVPPDVDTPPIDQAAPPSGSVTVTGQLFASQEYASLGARDPGQGGLERVLRVNVPRIEQQLPAHLTPLFPLYLQVREQTPAGGELPLTAEAPELDAGPHLSYAVQWFLFAGTAVIAYTLFLRSRLRDDEPAQPAPDPFSGA